MVRFSEFGEPNPQRPVEDLAFSVARFIRKGGSFVNYYMVGYLGSLLVLVLEPGYVPSKVFKFL